VLTVTVRTRAGYGETVIADDRLSVLGHASGEVEPDRLEWTLIVREADGDPRAAFDRCSQRLNALAGALSMAQVTTGAAAVSPERDYETGRPTGRHEAHAALTAVAALALGGEVAATAMEAGADELRGPRLRLPDSDEIVDGLLADAVAAARRRAERMAAAAGRKLGRIVSMRDARIDEDFEFTDLHEAQVMSLRAGGGERVPAVIPRPQRLSAAVAVVFELT
jgi:uncharacterized protein YggE